jgi:hypothetical protein
MGVLNEMEAKAKIRKKINRRSQVCYDKLSRTNWVQVSYFFNEIHRKDHIGL